MKKNFLSLMGMRLRGRRMNDPEITRKSPGNHPLFEADYIYFTPIVHLRHRQCVGSGCGNNI